MWIVWSEDRFCSVLGTTGPIKLELPDLSNIGSLFRLAAAPFSHLRYLQQTGEAIEVRRGGCCGASASSTAEEWGKECEEVTLALNRCCEGWESSPSAPVSELTLT